MYIPAWCTLLNVPRVGEPPPARDALVGFCNARASTSSDSEISLGVPKRCTRGMVKGLLGMGEGWRGMDFFLGGGRSEAGTLFFYSRNARVMVSGWFRIRLFLGCAGYRWVACYRRGNLLRGWVWNIEDVLDERIDRGSRAFPQIYGEGKCVRARARPLQIAVWWMCSENNWCSTRKLMFTQLFTGFSGLEIELSTRDTGFFSEGIFNSIRLSGLEI